VSLLLREQGLDILDLYATRAARRPVGAPFASSLGLHGTRGAGNSVTTMRLDIGFLKTRGECVTRMTRHGRFETARFAPKRDGGSPRRDG
jgi:hypothetical protein